MRPSTRRRLDRKSRGYGPAVYSDPQPPKISADEFWAKLSAIAGRSLSAAERDRAERLCRRRWLLRPIADDLFGEANVDRFFAPQTKAA